MNVVVNIIKLKKQKQKQNNDKWIKEKQKRKTLNFKVETTETLFFIYLKWCKRKQSYKR